MSLTSVSYQRSILPVYVGTGQPESHEGTRFLLRVGDNLFLVSACHWNVLTLERPGSDQLLSRGLSACPANLGTR
jgi:hypothetical protein